MDHNNINYLNNILNIFDSFQSNDQNIELNNIISRPSSRQSRNSQNLHVETFANALSGIIISSLTNYINQNSVHIVNSIINIFNETDENNEYNNVSSNFSMKYSQLEDYNKEKYKTCSICIDDYDNDSQITITHCDHSYHSNCIEEWIKVRKNCPVCRSDF